MFYFFIYKKKYPSWKVSWEIESDRKLPQLAAHAGLKLTSCSQVSLRMNFTPVGNAANKTYCVSFFPTPNGKQKAKNRVAKQQEKYERRYNAAAILCSYQISDIAITTFASEASSGSSGSNSSSSSHHSDHRRYSRAIHARRLSKQTRATNGEIMKRKFQYKYDFFTSSLFPVLSFWVVGVCFFGPPVRILACYCWLPLLGSCRQDYRDCGAFMPSPGQLLLPCRHRPSRHCALIGWKTKGSERQGRYLIVDWSAGSVGLRHRSQMSNKKLREMCSSDAVPLRVSPKYLIALLLTWY